MGAGVDIGAGIIAEAIAAYQAGDPHRAARLFREAKTKPLTEQDAGWCDLYLGAISREAGDSTAAVAHLNCTLQHDLPLGVKVNAHYHLGMVFWDLRDPRRAAEHLVEVQQRAPDSPGALGVDAFAESVFLLGCCQYELEQYESALGSFLAAHDLELTEDEENQRRRARIDVLIGQTLYRLRRYADAVTYLERSLRPERPLDAESRAIGEHYLAVTRYALGREQEAVTLLRHVLGEGSDSPGRLPGQYRAAACWALGRIYCGQDRYGEALVWLEQALQLADETLQRAEPIGSFAADCLVELGRVDEALPRAKAAYEKNPDEAIRAICFAKVLSVLGEYSQADAVLAAVEPEKLTPWERARLLAHKCWVFASLGKKRQYEECYTALERLDPDSRYIRDRSGRRWLPPPGELR